MTFSDNAYMGTYDADISWTLESFHSESPQENFLDPQLTRTSNHNIVGDPYRYRVPYQSDGVSQLDAADAEDDDTNDWPDKEGGLNSGKQRASRIVPNHLLPLSWHSVIQEARTSGLSSMSIRPYQQIDSSLRSRLMTALQGVDLRSDPSTQEITESSFPPAQALDLFLRLYMKYVHTRFPVLHLPTFDIYNTSPLLLVAMMFLGSSHSRGDRGRFSRLFYDHLRIAVSRSTEIDNKAVSSIGPPDDSHE